MLDDYQLTHFRNTQVSSLMDACKIHVHSVTRNDYKEEIATYTPGNEIACGLQQTGGQENQKDKNTVVSYDAILRLPHGTSFDLQDKVEITKRFGATINPTIIYDFVSPPYEGPSGIRVLLKKSTL